MANWKINAYDADIWVPQFKGLMQYGGSMNVYTQYATEAENVETFGGVLQPAAQCLLLPETLPAPIETLARLHRRWHTGEEPKDILIAAAGGKIYAKRPDGWEELNHPDGMPAYQSNVWSYVAYEINPEGLGASVDVLLMSNAKDGMVMVRGDTLTVHKVNCPKKFGVIERYAERIWGGAIEGDPDMLVYSAPYDPTDWTANVDIPEDGAGDIMQPSWDGDSFTALRSFGAQLIAFKKTRVWRILGTDPGEYTMKEQYGGGAPLAATIAVDTERILALTSRGVVSYDGLAMTPFQQDYTDTVWNRVNRGRLDQARAVLWKNSYYIALPLDGARENNAVLIYNGNERSWLLRTDVKVENWLATEDELYFTSNTTPGQVWQWQEDSWRTGRSTTSATRWVSPWIDLNYKKMQKGGFELYFLMEVQGQPAQLQFSIQTEKKIKSKTYIGQPMTMYDTANGKSAKQKKLHFGGAGRRFKIIVESPVGCGPWRLVGGLHVVAETDMD